MSLLDMMYEQAFNERMDQAEAHGSLVRMANDALDEKEYDAAFLAWLLTGSHDWPTEEQTYAYIPGVDC